MFSNRMIGDCLRLLMRTINWPPVTFHSNTIPFSFDVPFSNLSFSQAYKNLVSFQSSHAIVTKIPKEPQLSLWLDQVAK